MLDKKTGVPAAGHQPDDSRSLYDYAAQSAEKREPRRSGAQREMTAANYYEIPVPPGESVPSGRNMIPQLSGTVKSAGCPGFRSEWSLQSFMFIQERSNERFKQEDTEEKPNRTPVPEPADQWAPGILFPVRRFFYSFFIPPPDTISRLTGLWLRDIILSNHHDFRDPDMAINMHCVRQNGSKGVCVREKA